MNEPMRTYAFLFALLCSLGCGEEALKSAPAGQKSYKSEQNQTKYIIIDLGDLNQFGRFLAEGDSQSYNRQILEGSSVARRRAVKLNCGNTSLQILFARGADSEQNGKSAQVAQQPERGTTRESDSPRDTRSRPLAACLWCPVVRQQRIPLSRRERRRWRRQE